jgi:hypothetical protein
MDFLFPPVRGMARDILAHIAKVPPDFVFTDELGDDFDGRFHMGNLDPLIEIGERGINAQLRV